MRSIRLIRRGAPLTVLLVLATAFAPGATALSKTPFNTNLLKNPGAEAKVGGNGYTGAGPTKWTLESGAWKVVKYGSPGFPTTAEANRIGGGKNFFSCGPAVATGSMFQRIRLLGRNSQIDGELLQFRFDVRIATYDSQQDYGSAGVIFEDAEHDALSIHGTGAVEATNGIFMTRTITNVVPAGARYAVVVLVGDRVGGASDYCDAYFDKVSLVLRKL